MNISDSKVSDSKTKVKKVSQTRGKENRPAPKPKTVSKVEYRAGYIALYRQRHTDEWRIKGAGEQVARNKEMLEGAIPPNATEAFILELELPFENK
jgi:hypothetical protein